MRALTLLAAATLVAGCEVNLNTEGLSAREVKTFKVTGQPEVVLDTFDGAIELHSWDKNEIEVEVEKRAMEQVLLDEIKIDAQQQGDKIIVKVTGPNRGDHRGITIGMHISPTARLRVAVPRTANINATSGDGSIRAEAIEGRIVLHTTDGSVSGTRLGGDIQVRSGDGSIRIDNTTGKLDLETDDGSIGVDAKASVLRLRSGDGSIRATLEPDTVMTDNWDITTSDGTVTVTLPGLFSAELDAETSDGSVRTNHPLLGDDRRDERREGEDGDERRERRRTLRARIGDGGKILKIRSGDGTISIVR
jgi:Putative adhesin